MSGDSFLVQLWHFSCEDTPFAIDENNSFSRMLFTECVQEPIVNVISLFNAYMYL